MNDLTLNDYIYDRDTLEMSESQIEDLVRLVCKRCSVKTYTRVRSNLTYSLSHIPQHGILNRLTWDASKLEWNYCAGQSYPDEIRTVREIIRDLK